MKGTDSAEVRSSESNREEGSLIEAYKVSLGLRV